MARWRTSSGSPSATRWPLLSHLGWLLPLDPRLEFSLAAKDVIENHWDLGYRGLIPGALARLLFTPPAGRSPQRSQCPLGRQRRFGCFAATSALGVQP